MPMFNRRWPVVVALSVTTLAVPPLLNAQSRGSGPEGDVGSGYHSGSAATGQYGTSGVGTTPESRQTTTGDLIATDDHRILQDIQQKLQTDPSLTTAAQGVTVEVKSGAVTLRGPVKNDKEKADIGRRVQEVAGVKTVNNQLQTAPNLGGTTSGTAADGPSARLGSGPEMNDDTAMSGSQGRGYTSASEAPDPYAAPAAHQKLTHRHVTSMTPSRTGSDEWQNRSQAQFLSQPERDLIQSVRENLQINSKTADAAKDIKIGANLGTVTLQGFVASERDRDQIVAVTRDLKGVDRVDDQLRVSGGADTRSEMPSASDITGRTGSSVSHSAATMTLDSRLAQNTYGKPSLPATGSRGAQAADDVGTAGSGEMHEEDRTGTSGPSGTQSFSTGSTGAVDATGRAAKPAGDYATTTVDRGLAASIRTSLQGDPTLAVTNDNLQISVDNGNVILRGWVNNEQQREAISERVRGVAGVQSVQNQMEIGSRPLSSK